MGTWEQKGNSYSADSRSISSFLFILSKAIFTARYLLLLGFVFIAYDVNAAVAQECSSGHKSSNSVVSHEDTVDVSFSKSSYEEILSIAYSKLGIKIEFDDDAVLKKSVSVCSDKLTIDQFVDLLVEKSQAKGSIRIYDKNKKLSEVFIYHRKGQDQTLSDYKRFIFEAKSAAPSVTHIKYWLQSLPSIINSEVDLAAALVPIALLLNANYEKYETYIHELALDNSVGQVVRMMAFELLGANPNEWSKDTLLDVFRDKNENQSISAFASKQLAANGIKIGSEILLKYAGSTSEARVHYTQALGMLNYTKAFKEVVHELETTDSFQLKAAVLKVLPSLKSNSDTYALLRIYRKHADVNKKATIYDESLAIKAVHGIAHVLGDEASSELANIASNTQIPFNVRLAATMRLQHANLPYDTKKEVMQKVQRSYENDKTLNAANIEMLGQIGVTVSHKASTDINKGDFAVERAGSQKEIETEIKE